MARKRATIVSDPFTQMQRSFVHSAELLRVESQGKEEKKRGKKEANSVEGRKQRGFNGERKERLRLYRLLTVRCAVVRVSFDREISLERAWSVQSEKILPVRRALKG